MDHVALLRAMYATIKNGESTVEETFGKGEPEQKKPISNPFKDDDPAKPEETKSATSAPAEEQKPADTETKPKSDGKKSAFRDLGEANGGEL